MNYAGKRRESPAGIDVPGNDDEDRNDGRLQIGRQMKSAFIEWPNLSRSDSRSLWTQENRIAGSAQHVFGMLETAHALRTVGLGRCKENTDEITDDCEWRNQPVFTFEEESRSRQSQREQDKHIQRRRVVGDKDRLRIGHRIRSMPFDTDPA